MRKLHGLTEKIIGCAFKLSNTLGCGFLEKVYENALVIRAWTSIAIDSLDSLFICVHLRSSVANSSWQA